MQTKGVVLRNLMWALQKKFMCGVDAVKGSVKVSVF